MDAKSYHHWNPAKVITTQERRNGNTLRPASGNAITSFLLFAPPMVCLVVKHLPLPNDLLQSWQPNGKNRTHKSVDTFRLA
jgi:hypothetical protein